MRKMVTATSQEKNYKPLCMPTQLSSNIPQEPCAPPLDLDSAPLLLFHLGAGRKLGLMKLRIGSDLYEDRKRILCTIKCGTREVTVDVKNSQVLKRWLEKNLFWFR